MKIFGIILTVLGAINFSLLIIALGKNPEDSDKIAKAFGPAMTMIVVGVFLISRANKKKKELEGEDK